MIIISMLRCGITVQLGLVTSYIKSKVHTNTITKDFIYMYIFFRISFV